MERNLNENELNFIKREISRRENIEVEFDDSKVKVKKRENRKENKPLKFYQKFSFWAGVMIVIPIIISMFLVNSFMRIEKVFGAGSLDFLSKDEVTDEMLLQLEINGFNGLPELISFYENKEIIIGVIFTVFILIAASFMILDVVQNKIRDKKHV